MGLRLGLLGALSGLVFACQQAAREPGITRGSDAGAEAAPWDTWERDGRARALGSLPPSDPCVASDCSVPGSPFNLDPDDPFRQHWMVSGDSRAGTPSRTSAAGCTGLGPDVHYELDLRAFREPVLMHAFLRADFDGSIRIERGPSDDPFVIACNDDHASGAREAFLALTLAPDHYRIVVDGQGTNDGGLFELTVELPSPGGRCFRAPPNDLCSTATRIDPARSVQTFVGTTECASDQLDPPWECGEYAWRAGEVFYEIDTSDRSEALILHATTDLPPLGSDAVLILARSVGGECAESLSCSDRASLESNSTELWARLAPGRHLLAVEGNDGAAIDFGLRVELLPDPCTVSNDTCQSAQAIAPTSGSQSFTVWPMCANDTLVTSCNRVLPTPDIFYRLDLAAFEALVRVQARAERGAGAYEGLILMAGASGTCGAELWCGAVDLWLEPSVYYLALDGFRDQFGPVELTIEIETEEPPERVVCIDERVAFCARDFDCCAGNQPECWLVFISCGLDPAQLDCLCAADPACCDGRGDTLDCGALLDACGAFCDGFDPAVSCPEE